MNSFRSSLRRDRRGGIEGLPLQLMIIILVATMGSAVIIGWMGNIETPHMISDVEVEKGSYEVTLADGPDSVEKVVITVYDQDGNPLDGATVYLEGLGVKKGSDPAVTETTNGGQATFEGLTVNMHGTVGKLGVNVSKSGYGENNSLSLILVEAPQKT